MDELAGSLVASGVRFVTGVTGSGPSQDLILALERRGVEYLEIAHEGGAVVAAGAHGHHTGVLACAIGIKGPGLANMIGGILACAYESWPVLTITESYGHDPSNHRQHKRLDHPKALAAFVKGHAERQDPDVQIPTLVRLAQGEIPGPVHLDLAEGLTTPAPLEIPDPDPSRLDPIARALGAASRPLFIVGSVAGRLGLGEALSRLNVPILTTVPAKGVLDETLPHAAGIYTGSGGPLSEERALILRSDLVIGIGLRPRELLGVAPLGIETHLIDVVDDPSQGGLIRSVCPPRVTGEDVRRFVESCRETRAWGHETIRESRDRVREALGLASAEAPWDLGPFLDRLQNLWGRRSRVVVDTGQFCTAMEHLWRARTPLDLTLSAGGRFMGTAIPMAIGIQRVRPSQPTICITGDGGIRPHLADLAGVAIRRDPLLIVLMRDGGYGSIVAARRGRDLSEASTRVGPPTWVGVFEGLGIPATSVQDLAAASRALEDWDPAQGPRFLEARFEPDRYGRGLEGIR